MLGTFEKVFYVVYFCIFLFLRECAFVGVFLVYDYFPSDWVTAFLLTTQRTHPKTLGHKHSSYYLLWTSCRRNLELVFRFYFSADLWVYLQQLLWPVPVLTVLSTVWRWPWLSLDGLLAMQRHLEVLLNPAFIALDKSCITSEAVLLGWMLVVSCALQTENSVFVYHAAIALIPRLFFRSIIKES